MKQLLIVLSLFFSVHVSAQDEVQNDVPFDSMSPEAQMELAIAYSEKIVMDAVNPLVEEGRYMQALELLDSIEAKLKKVADLNLTPRMYMKRALIYMQMEEWHNLVLTTTDCVNYHKDTMPDDVASLIYDMQGTAYKNLKFYQMAIRSYEKAYGYYSKSENFNLSGPANTQCDIADCYSYLKKYSAASSCYERGLSLYFKYFNVTKDWLLKNDLRVTDSYKETVLGVFGAHLYKMYLYELECGDTFAAKECLLLSSHCGNSLAKGEYQRIYGH